ncbi:MAG: hypothetical protein RL392_1138 [Pseudomonadota bacterium]|jgi:hypothetical protein
MADEMKKEVKWNDRTLLTRSVIAWGFLSILFLAIGENAKPPEGYAFERLPTVSGVYQCCGSGGRTSESRVGSVIADCASMEYFPLTGVSWHDCRHKEELVGRVVEIERTTVPVFFSGQSVPIVIKLSSGGKKYLDYSDKDIRDLWISRMRTGAVSLATTLTLIFSCIQLIYLNRKSKNLSRGKI